MHHAPCTDSDRLVSPSPVRSDPSVGQGLQNRQTGEAYLPPLQSLPHAVQILVGPSLMCFVPDLRWALGWGVRFWFRLAKIWSVVGFEAS